MNNDLPQANSSGQSPSKDDEESASDPETSSTNPGDPLPVIPPPSTSGATPPSIPPPASAAGSSHSSPPPQERNDLHRILTTLGQILAIVLLVTLALFTVDKYRDLRENANCHGTAEQAENGARAEGKTEQQVNDARAKAEAECNGSNKLGINKWTDEQEQWLWLGFALLTSVLAVGGLVIAASSGWRLMHPDLRPGELGIGATLISSAALVIALAATVTIVVYVLPTTKVGFERWRAYGAVGAGILTAVLVAMANATLRRGPASAQRQSRVFDQLHERFTALDAHLHVVCSNANPLMSDPFLKLMAEGDCREATEHRDRMGEAMGLLQKSSDVESNGERTKRAGEPGAKWINGTGYAELWNRLHDAEEALLVVSPREQVIAAALFDETRLYGSNIENRDNLLDRLRRAILVLGGQAYLSSDVRKLLSDIVSAADGTAEVTQARLVLRDVRHAINQFRDDSREALIRARNQLMWTGMLTGVASFAILALAILVGAPPQAVVAAAVFFLVGSVVGLFDQLRSSGTALSPEEDFGLGRARLVFTPYLSGLAGVGGVLITAMLYATVTGSVVTYQPPTAAPTTVADLASLMTGTASTGEAAETASVNLTATPTATATPAPPVAAHVQLEPPPLSLVFDLDDNRFGLVIAAIFGLAPSLLVERLQGEANRYKADLQSTSGQERTS